MRQEERADKIKKDEDSTRISDEERNITKNNIAKRKIKVKIWRCIYEIEKENQKYEGKNLTEMYIMKTKIKEGKVKNKNMNWYALRNRNGQIKRNDKIKKNENSTRR